jgi:integrase
MDLDIGLSEIIAIGASSSYLLQQYRKMHQSYTAMHERLELFALSWAGNLITRFSMVAVNSHRLYLSDWLNTPVIHITRDQIEARHREIILRSILNFAAEYRDAKGLSIIPDNPVRRLSAKKIWNRVERRQTVIKPHELHAWYEAVTKLENTTLRDYLLLVLFTGLRREEAAQLEWSRVDMQARTLTILDTKNRQPHVLPLSDSI